MRLLRPVIIAAALIGLWQAVVWATAVPFFILPGPGRVLAMAVDRWDVLAMHAWVTAAEIVLGLAIGVVIGVASAIVIASFGAARAWVLPLLVVSQALPVFALAPLLTLWFGYGMASKVAMAVLIIYFPVTAAFYDGLRRTDPVWLDLARTMDATPAALLRHVRVPSALPAFSSGVRIAASVAPIGAVVGEWVGSSRGLGYLMLHANGRMQTDLMFAALIVLAGLALTVYFVIDHLLRRLVHWSPEAMPDPHLVNMGTRP